MKSVLSRLALAAIIAASTIAMAHAEETVGEKAATTSREAGTQTKKGWNKTKKTARNMTGNESKKKDTAEKKDEVTDSVSNKVEEKKDKID